MYDLYLAPLKNSRKPFGFYYKQAVLVTGATKLAQRFLRCLLTPPGTDLEGYFSGTALADIVGGNSGDVEYVTSVVSSSIDSAAAQLKRIDALNPSGLSVENAKVIRLESVGTALTVFFEIRASDGSSIAVTLPVT